MAYTPGTKMPEQRIGSAEDRAALMGFLEKATKSQGSASPKQPYGGSLPPAPLSCGRLHQFEHSVRNSVGCFLGQVVAGNGDHPVLIGTGEEAGRA